MAFQIQDDLLDEEQDQNEQNMSILRYESRETAFRRMQRHIEAALHLLAEIKELDTNTLKGITVSLIHRES